jgi:putative peptidoglycan lipid II flippase
MVDVLLRGGAFHRADSGTMAIYLGIFSVSLCLWSAQAIYARAFYAAGNTLTPMIAGTVVTLISLPVYWWLYRSIGPAGLAVASDVGILIQTLTLVALLHRRRMVSFAELEFGEILRSIIAAAAGYVGLIELRHLLPQSTSRLYELGLLAVACVAWVGISAVALKLMGSTLPDQLTARFRRRQPSS